MFYNGIVEELQQLQAQQKTVYVVEEEGQCEWSEFNVHVGALTQVVGGGTQVYCQGYANEDKSSYPKRVL